MPDKKEKISLKRQGYSRSIQLPTVLETASALCIILKSQRHHLSSQPDWTLPMQSIISAKGGYIRRDTMKQYSTPPLHESTKRRAEIKLQLNWTLNSTRAVTTVHTTIQTVRSTHKTQFARPRLLCAVRRLLYSRIEQESTGIKRNNGREPPVAHDQPMFNCPQTGKVMFPSYFSTFHTQAIGSQPQGA